jgi:hypothetical protein
VAAELCDPVVIVVVGALETEEEEGDEALGVAAGAEEEEEGEDALGVTAGALETEEEVGDDALGVTAGALVTEEEGEDAPGFTKGALDLTYRENILGVGADEVDGARVTMGAGVTDALGDPAEYVTFLTTSSSVSQK